MSKISEANVQVNAATLAFAKDLDTKVIIAAHNFLNDNGAPVKKFADRKTAEVRLAKMISQRIAQNDSFKDLRAVIVALEAVKLIGEGLSKDAQLKYCPPVKAASAPKPPASARPAAAPHEKKQPEPILNLRCPSCGYFAKVWPSHMAIARLKCPVDKSHGDLLTAEERNEKRGRKTA